MGLAKKIVKQAKNGGANAVKFQAYKADTLVVKSAKAYWDTSKEKISSQHELFKKHEGFWENEMKELKLFCDETGIDFICTPFDEESANFLNKIVSTRYLLQILQINLLLKRFQSSKNPSSCQQVR